MDLAYQVRNHFPDCEIIVSELSFEDSRNYRASAELAKSKLSFSPTYNIDDGIIELKKLLEEKRVKNVQDDRFYNENYLKRYIKVI